MKRNSAIKQSLILCIIFSIVSITFAQDVVVGWEDNWAYYDVGNTPPSQTGNIQWYEYNYQTDSLWKDGAAQLGYGDGDETTITNNSITQYFRKDFLVSDSTIYDNFDLDLLFDDGAVIYLNGISLGKIAMPNGTISYNTFASSTNENAIASGNFTNTLRTGVNVIAVEVHQTSSGSSDISFDFKLQLNQVGYTKIVRGPYLQNASPNSIVVKWRTALPSESIIRFGLNPIILNDSVSNTILKTEHEIEITGLNPNTKYFYEIANSDFVLSPSALTQYFKTPPVAGERQPVRAWILGDCGTKNDNQRNVRDAYYDYVDSNHTDLMLFLGDNAYNSGTDNEYQYALFENMYEDKLKNTIAYSCLGNHDGYSADSQSQTGPYYDIFTFPTAGESGGVPSGTEAYYSFDYANIHFIVLDSYETNRRVGQAMFNWCEADIQNTTAEWIVAMWHHPPYTKGSHNSDTETELVEMRQNFLPMLEANGIDLVLSGHSHSYERSYLLNGHYGNSFSFDINKNTIGDNGSGSGRQSLNEPYEKYILGPEAGEGAVYITAGSSGKNTGGQLNHKAMYYSLNELGSCILEVNQDTMQVKFLRENGLVQDYFSIIKGVCDYGGNCDDGDPCTTGDTLNADCECVGVFTDTDNDTVCDAFDQCPNFNDLQDEDNDGICDLNDLCPGFDDAIDVDNDAIPDDCDPCIAGVACNDLDNCTTNDAIDNNCNCTGVFQDADNDTVCDANDECNGFNDNIDVDNDNIADGCDPCITGATCDDNEACTIQDVYDAACNCSGVFLDTDNDGVCNIEDCAPINASISIIDACGNCGGPGAGTFNFTTSTLSHSGTGSKSISLMLDAVYENVSFQISDINNRQIGSNANRYIEKVGVHYINPQGLNYFYGNFLNQSTASINFNFPITGITLILSDNENDNTGTSLMSVNISTVSGCYSSCISTLNLESQISTDTYRADQTITSTGEIMATENVLFKAGVLINLANGFTANQGSSFFADIEDCQ